MRSLFLAWIAIAGSTAVGLAQTAPAGPAINVNLTEPGPMIPSTLVGVFFEDINFGADGGLMDERIKNRSFEFPNGLTGWHPVGTGVKTEVIRATPLGERNPHSLRLECTQADSGIANEGFRGIGVRSGTRYQFSAWLRAPGGGRPTMRVALCTLDGQTLTEARITRIRNDWRRYDCSLPALADEPKARLRLTLEQPGIVEADLVSLMPDESLKGPLRGFRRDLVNMLRDLKPGFLRFPGGCIVEGRRLALRYQWKNTLGDRDDRSLLINRWNDEFKHRPAPDYFQTFNLGFYEYFLLSEELGAEPLPILNCGMACQFNSGELAPLDELDPYIQDALDLIEFANGSDSTPWGRRRRDLGHAAPFNLKFLGIGNEQWGPQYLERYERFAKVLSVRHPEIRLVSSAGPSPSDERFEFLWPRLRELKADIIDEHCYAGPEWFYQNAGRYDGYDRSGPKVFMGEYAAQSVGVAKPENRNTWGCALAEAAFLTGIERNADLVVMSSYAPLFGHLDGWQWTPNLIWFDNLGVFGTPSYYVQQLFGRNRGESILGVKIDGSDRNGEKRLYVSAAQGRGEVILKIVNASPTARTVRIELAGARRLGERIRSSALAHADLNAENSLAQPLRVAPVESEFPLADPFFEHSLAGSSLTVLRIPCRP